MLDPLLMWTLLLISSQHHPELSDIFPGLRESHQKIWTRAVFANEYTLSVIQSLLLLTVWPLPVTKQKWDPSWRYCNLALAAAQQLGLHKPDSQWEYSSTAASPDTSVQTWAACVYVTTTLALDMGLPCPADDFLRDLANTNLVEPMSSHVQIQQRILHHVQATTPKDPFFAGAAIRTSMKDLEDIRAQKSEAWGPRTMLDFLGTQLKIHLHHLQLHSNTGDQKHFYNQL
jgi:hypothetical protein